MTSNARFKSQGHVFIVEIKIIIHKLCNQEESREGEIILKMHRRFESPTYLMSHLRSMGKVP
jgi:hypothetical protein